MGAVADAGATKGVLGDAGTAGDSERGGMADSQIGIPRYPVRFGVRPGTGFHRSGVRSVRSTILRTTGSGAVHYPVQRGLSDFSLASALPVVPHRVPARWVSAEHGAAHTASL